MSYMGHGSEHLHYESVYFKELHNEQEYYWPRIYGARAAVAPTITSGKWLHNLWPNWKGMQWPGFSIVLPIKVFSPFVAMSEVDFWCIHTWGKQTREMDIVLSKREWS